MRFGVCVEAECVGDYGMRIIRRVRRNGVREGTGVEFHEGRKGRRLTDQKWLS